MRPLPISILAVLAAAAWLGCSTSEEESSSGSATVLTTPTTRALYPNLEKLYTGDQGLYRGCGPNNGVCHNSREFPNLSSLASLVENIGLPCNEKRDEPTQIHDLCERPGDLLRIGGKSIEIAYVDRDPANDREFKLVLREPIAGSPASATIVRPDPQGEIPFLPFGELQISVTVDSRDPSGRSLAVKLPPAPVPEEGESEAEDDYILPIFSKAGVPADPQTIHVGDPNRNGVFGAALGGRIIAPGDPSKSYLFTRLTDPNAGPLMPRANCCYWSKSSLRALWCWVAGLEPDGSNALDPIAYDSCPPGPVDSMQYPDPGPSCETSGLCPVKPKAALGNLPTFGNLYEGVLKQSCAGSSCHIGAAAAGLDFGTKDRAYASLVQSQPPRVVPGDAAASLLYVKINPDACKDGCSLMPRGQPPLEPAARSLVERWISAGAKND